MPENEIKLLPCPFCGGEAEMFGIFGNGIDVCFVSCSKVDAFIKNKIERKMRRIAAENEQEQDRNDVDDKTHVKKRNA